ncbi:MAG: hypothetical protein KH415_17320 [Clostridium sp.]|nr:hypothetical protein [Clostridium sp.]
MGDKYNIAEKEINWISNNEKIPEVIKEKFLFIYEKNKLNLIVNDVEPQVLSAINTILRYIIKDKERVDDMLGYVYEKYEE